MNEIKEEFTDVCICMDILGESYIDREIYNSKIDRWIHRLKERNEKMTDLRQCRYCKGKAMQKTKEGRNYIGTPGWISVCYCTMCGMQVEAFNENSLIAEEKAADWWNRGIYDAKSDQLNN